jgi:hypothetical protein
MIAFLAPVPPEVAAGLSTLTFLTGWIFARFKTKPLRAFWVGTEDVYAARSESHALKLATDDGAKFLTLDDIDEVCGLPLYYPMPDEAETGQTVAQLLRKTRTPGWIATARG